jgi:sugar phosphate isomerase/epimerase
MQEHVSASKFTLLHRAKLQIAIFSEPVLSPRRWLQPGNLEQQLADPLFHLLYAVFACGSRKIDLGRRCNREGLAFALRAGSTRIVSSTLPEIWFQWLLRGSMEIDRRMFLQTGLGAALGTSMAAVTTRIAAQEPQPTGNQVRRPRHAAANPHKLQLDAYSRQLQWLRSAGEVADAVYETACDGVMVTVQPYPGHVAPERVEQDLPPFIHILRAQGLRVTQVRGPEITDPADPQVEAILRAGSQLGITHYWFGSDHYDLSKPIPPQLEALKMRMEKFVKLHQKYGATLMYQTRPEPTAIGSTVWDLLSVMQNFDPKYVGLHWDTGHMALHGLGMWEVLMRAAGPYLASIGWRDRGWSQDLGLGDQEGPYPGAEALKQRSGAGGRSSPARPPGAGGPPPMAERPIPLPLAGLIGRGNGWSSPVVPLGTGVLELPRLAIVLRDIGFNGPTNLQAEYPLGGAEKGADKVSLPPARILGAMKRDVLTLRSALMLAPQAGITV